jgi:streptomycin 6-kinase
MLVEIAQRWELKLSAPFHSLSYNYVAPVVCADGNQAVLKVGVPHPELMTEIEALRVFDGRGCVRLLKSDPEQGALLLERLVPGAPLSDIPDNERSISIAIQVMKQLWRPTPDVQTFPTVEDWATGFQRLRSEFDGGCGPFPPQLVEAAETLFGELLISSPTPMLLHGDLHHGNILSAERQPWLALDPKGLIGEPAYEVGALLRNPLPQLLEEINPREILSQRIDRFVEICGFDRQRLIGWGLAQAVLSGWWSYEDHGHGWEATIACAEHLAAIN